MKNYQYLCEDKSVTYPILKKYLWAPALRFIPLRRSANSITLLGNLCSLIGFVFLALVPHTAATGLSFLLPITAIFLYLSLDNIDGAQARRSGSSSPLGEFLDHWFDAFNTGFLVLGYCLAMKVPAWQTLLVLGLSGAAYFATMWEQRVTGWLHFGPIGSIEGVLLTCMMYGFVAAFGYDAVVKEPILGSLTGSQIFYVIACAGFAHQAVTSLLRVKGLRHLRDFVPFALVIAFSSVWYAVGDVQIAALAFLSMLVACLMGGREIIARVRELPYRSGGLVVVAGTAIGLVAALAGVDAVAQNVVAYSLVAYVGIKLAIDFVRTTSALSEYLRPRELLSVYFQRQR